MMYIIMQVYSYAYDVYVYYHTDSHTLITWPSSHPTLTPPKQRHLTYLNLALMWGGGGNENHHRFKYDRMIIYIIKIKRPCCMANHWVSMVMLFLWFFYTFRATPSSSFVWCISSYGHPWFYDVYHIHIIMQRHW
jgi:hypothetical protein